MKPSELAMLVSQGVTISHIVDGVVGLTTGESVLVRVGTSAGVPLRVLAQLVVP